MPKSTTSQATHSSVRHVAINNSPWLIGGEKTGQQMTYGGAMDRRKSAYAASGVGGNVRDEWEDQEHHSSRYMLTSDVDWRPTPKYSGSYIYECGAEEVDYPGNEVDDPSQYSLGTGLPAIAPRMNSVRSNHGESTFLPLHGFGTQFGSAVIMSQATTNCDMNQHSASVETEESQILVSPIVRRRAKALPDWVHPRWTRIFLPTLAHALYISKDPFDEFRPSSPTFIATVEMIFRLIYPDTEYDHTKNGAFVEEAARRLLSKKSKIASFVMDDVEQFLKQSQFANSPDDVKDYARWALLPDGPAFHETPTPTSCKFERGHKDYIEPKGTFESPFIRKAAKHFLLQAKGSVLDPAICASNPPKGLYALLLVSVERAFTAFKTGSYIKPKTKFSHKKCHTQLETYLMHLDTVNQRTWETILRQAYASDLIRGTVEECAEASAMSINRRNLVFYL